jgi:hypothetical protein
MRSATTLAILAILGTASTAQAETLEAHTLTSTTKVALDVESTGRFQKLTVRLSNRTKVAHTVKVSQGTFFKPVDAVQPLAVTRPAERVVQAGATVTLTLDTACMDPAKAVASAGYKAWSAANDLGLAGLLVGLELVRAFPLFSQWFSTPEKARQTVQGVIWVYYDASKPMMTRFATTHMFSGDQAAAKTFIDAVYPVAKSMLAFYKQSIPR